MFQAVWKEKYDLMRVWGTTEMHWSYQANCLKCFESKSFLSIIWILNKYHFDTLRTKAKPCYLHINRVILSFSILMFLHIYWKVSIQLHIWFKVKYWLTLILWNIALFGLYLLCSYAFILLINYICIYFVYI